MTIESLFLERRAAGRKLLVPYITGGYASDWVHAVQAVADAGRNWPGLSTSLIGPDGETPVAAGLAVANAEPQASVAAAQTGAKVQTN